MFWHISEKTLPPPSTVVRSLQTTVASRHHHFATWLPSRLIRLEEPFAPGLSLSLCCLLASRLSLSSCPRGLLATSLHPDFFAEVDAEIFTLPRLLTIDDTTRKTFCLEIIACCPPTLLAFSPIATSVVACVLTLRWLSARCDNAVWLFRLPFQREILPASF